MRTNIESRQNRSKERGATLVLILVSTVIFAAVAGVAIDLVALYVVRSEAQRAADTAALAGATTLVTSGYTSGGSSQAAAQTAATNQATTIATRNLVDGAAPNVTVTFNNMQPIDGLPNPSNPQITVAVDFVAPTYFEKVFGFKSYDVYASATAEVYNPSGVPAPPTMYCTGCIKPILLPNCDAVPGAPPTLPPAACPAGYPGEIIDPNSGQIQSPAQYPAGIIGEEITFSNNGTLGVMWYPVSIDGSMDPIVWASNITSCNPVLHTCADILPTLPTASIGYLATTTALDTLIHAATPGPLAGQDTIFNATITGGPLPFTITGGFDNPNPNVIGQTILQSDSIATFPIYDGHPLNPAGDNATIIGFIQLFIENATPPGTPPPTETFLGMVLNVSGCGTNGGICGTTGGGGGSGTAASISGGGASAVPVRLISN